MRRSSSPCQGSSGAASAMGCGKSSFALAMILSNAELPPGENCCCTSAMVFGACFAMEFSFFGGLGYLSRFRFLQGAGGVGGLTI